MTPEAHDVAVPLMPTWPFRRSVRTAGNALRDYVLAPFVKHWITLTVEGAEHLDQVTTPSLFIFNHSDDLDGPVSFAALPRRIRRRLSVAVGADILDDHHGLAFFIRLSYAAFAFERRNPSRRSLEYLREVIDSGWHVLLSPEGRLSTTGDLLDFKAGVGLLAVKLGVPVVPMRIVGLSGTVPMHAWWPKRHSDVTVRIGEPLRFGPDEKYRAATRALREAVESL
jgi:1-acyl-sn-glycerol-3-phosphate acyltransferase